MQQFRLRYRAHDIELVPGEFLVGRSEECQLSIDDAMVSRKHVAFRVGNATVILADLGSRNGVSVNGEKISGERMLNDGDRVSIGKHELVFCIVNPDSQRSRGFLARTLGPVELKDLETAVSGRRSSRPPPSAALAKVISSIATLGLLADKTLALGRPEEAERILSVPFTELMKEMRKGAEVDATVLGRFAVYAIRLATELQTATWVEWLLEAYGVAQLVLPAPIIDELFTIAPKLKHLSRQPLLEYVKAVSDIPNLNANDRFLLQRLEGLGKRLATIP